MMVVCVGFLIGLNFNVKNIYLNILGNGYITSIVSEIVRFWIGSKYNVYFAKIVSFATNVSQYIFQSQTTPGI